jgi:hypothetical protein
VGGERLDDYLGKRDNAAACFSLWRCYDGFLARQQYELLGNFEAPTKEVDVVQGQSECLTLAKSSTCCRHNEAAVPSGHCVCEREDLVRLEGDHAAPFTFWQCNPVAWARRYESIAHRCPKDRSEIAIHQFNGRGCENVGAPLDPSLNLGPAHGTEWPMREVGENVPTKVRFDLRRGRWTVNTTGLPFGCIFTE